MRQLLVEHAQVASQFASIALRFLFEAAKRLDELVDLDFGTVRQAVDPLKPNREGNTKRDRHTGTGADRNPSFGRHENVAWRMKKPALRSVFATRSLPASVASTEKLPVPTTFAGVGRFDRETAGANNPEPGIAQKETSDRPAQVWFGVRRLRR